MSEKHKNFTAAAVIVLALVFLTTGVLREEHTMVWLKAVNVCMECIGLG